MPTTYLALLTVAASTIGSPGTGAAGVERPGQDDLEVVVVDHDNFEIGKSCRLTVRGGPIRDEDGNGVVHVVAEGVTVDLDGTVLAGSPVDTAPNAYSGTGLVVRAKGVTVRNARVRGFKVGIRAIEADGLVLEHCDVSDNYRARLGSTPEREASSDWLYPHDNDGTPWREQYGAGISVESSKRVRVRRCRARDVQNGLILDRVDESLVYDNDFSFLSGWGIAMWRANRNIVSRNAVDFCIRGYSHGVYNRGQDSAGILMFEQCSSNVVAENSATHSGDAIFAFAGLAALGEGPAADPELDLTRRGNNDNIFANNDLSYAAAHGLEITFSFGNQIFGNRMVDNAICGIWGGYSRDTLITENLFAKNGAMAYGLERGGVNIEHGQRNVVLRNRFEANECGVHLWWDEDPHLADKPWTVANGFGSGDNLLIGNEFDGDEVAVQLRAAGPTTLADNRMQRVETELEADDASPVKRLDGLDVGWTAPEFPVFGDTRPIGARSELEGRDKIVVLEWGPYDWSRPLLTRVPDAALPGAHRYRLLAASELSDVTTGDDVEVERTADGLVVRARRAAAGGGSIVRYALDASADGSPVHAEGLLIDAPWSARVFEWTVDPREDEAAFDAAAEAARAFELADLDLPFGGDGPARLVDGAPDVADRFGVVATTEVHFPAGDWALETVSDDGIRVLVDGEVVIDDWTHHASTPHVAELSLDEPRTVALEVRYFELSGGAHLSARITAR